MDKKFCDECEKEMKDFICLEFVEIEMDWGREITKEKYEFCSAECVIKRCEKREK